MKSINILGFGTMGIQLVAFFNVIGYKVTVWNRSFSDAKLKKLSMEIRIIEKKLGCTTEKQEMLFLDKIDLMPPTTTIEALIEDIAIKQAILNNLPFELQTHRLFTNSSSFSPEEIHKEAQALHFFNPLHSVKLVETTCPLDSLPLFSDIQNAGMTIVQTKANRGYIANFILFREIAASIMLVEKFGYDTKTVDKVLEALGRQSSVFDIIDFVGVDVTKSILENLHEVDATLTVSPLLCLALDSRILGKKNKTSIRLILDNHNGVVNDSKL
jgi:3-hydroxyacyl-CoA dehydrogenase